MKWTRRRFIVAVTALGVSSCRRRPDLPFPELEASGSPGDIGMAHGRTFAARIRNNLRFYVSWLSDSGRFPKSTLLARAHTFETVLADHFPHILEEIDGISRGAGLSLDEILLINARTDVRAMTRAELARSTAHGCTALALSGSLDGRPTLALSQNWDWDPALADAPVVLRLRPDNGPALVSLVEAGMAGKIGFNEHRLGVCLNFLSHISDGQPDQLGVPIHCLLRAAMACRDLDEVVRTIKTVPRVASANFLLAQHLPGGTRRAIDLEITPQAVAVVTDPEIDLIHTNHFLDPELARGCDSQSGPSTTTRFDNARRLSRELTTVRDPVRRSQRILESRDGLPYPISRHHNPDPDSSTLAGIVMDLSGNRLLLTRGAPHRAEWVDRPGAP